MIKNYLFKKILSSLAIISIKIKETKKFDIQNLVTAFANTKAQRKNVQLL